MRRGVLCFGVAASFFTLAARADDKITYQDQVLPIFRASCVNCHNPDKKKAGLDVASFSALMAGSSGGKVVEPGDSAGSLLYRLVTHADEPKMPPKGGKLADKDLETIKKWIEGGLLETSGSAAVVSSRPKVDLKVTGGAGRPEGPAPMPGDLLRETLTRTARTGAPTALAASPWAPLSALGGQKQILLYQPQSQKLLGVLPFPEGWPYAMRFSRNGKLLLAAGGAGAKSGKAVLFDIAAGMRLAEVGDELDSVLAADVSPDQAAVAMGGTDKIVKVFATSSGALMAKIRKHTDWVTAVAYSPDNVLLATADRSGGLYVWEATSGNLFYTLDGHKASVTSLAYRADSNVLASASEDGTIKLWDMAGGGQIKSWNAHDGGVLCVDFAQDGRLVSGGRDKRVKFWGPDGSAKGQSEPFGDIVLQAAFVDGGATAVAGDWSGEVRVLSPDGKPAGKLNLDPPPLAERKVEADKRLAAAQASRDAEAAELKKLQEQLKAVEKKAQEAAAQFQQAKADAEELELAQLFTGVHAAQEAMAAREAALAAAQRAAEQAEAKAKQAASDAEAAEKAAAAAFEKIKAQETEVAKAESAIASSQSAVDRATANVSSRQSLMAPAEEATAKLAAAAAAAPEDKSLAEAVAKSKESVEALKRSVKEAGDALSSATVVVKSVQDAATAAKKAVEASQTEADVAAKAASAKKAAVAPANQEAADRRKAAEALKPAVDAAKANYGTLRAQYDERKKQLAAESVKS